MPSAPIVVHRPSVADGQRITVYDRSRDEILGTTYSEHNLVVLLEGAGVAEPEEILDRDGPAHEFSAAEFSRDAAAAGPDGGRDG
ncbi:hypothetical protein [Streptomyces sp. NPDC088180]|uniref:hypothetical protein n=1 Tax=Streptomyces sp. NPDC088180 TaxID=3365837 RepID=UPI0037FAC9D8